MCAIYGFGSKAKLTRAQQRLALDLMQALAQASMVRGQDAAGFAAATMRGELIWHRAPGLPCDIFAGPEFAEVRRHRVQMFVGHDRQATHGAPARNGNNHPHIVGDWAIVHNGVIPNHIHAAARFGLQLKSECDSELLAHLVAQHGPSVGPRLCISLPGSQSVLALNAHARQMLAWTNGKMPLACFEVDGHPARFFASTRELALVAAEWIGATVAFAPVRPFVIYRMEGRQE